MIVVFFIAYPNQIYCKPVSFKKIDAVTVESPEECPTPTHTDTQFGGFKNQLQALCLYKKKGPSDHGLQTPNEDINEKNNVWAE